ncbi:tetraspanin-9 [Culicoides brevitarsis]|uniref:tetraspanin-9 n=1 Tax=Culicoides brevitarsis TaxID=469753 RepID=UPI00307BA3E1
MKLATKIKCLKYLVYAYIILLTIVGACQIVIGGGLIYMHMRYKSITYDAFYWPAIILLLSGPAVFLLSWFGWNAAAKKHRSYLTVFSVGLVALLCVQFWICGYAVSVRESLPSAAEYQISNSFHEYFRNQSDTNHIWNRLQTDMKCCGIFGVMDYRHASQRASQPAIPWACCSQSEDPHEPFCKHVFQRGCLQALSEDNRKGLLICALTAIACAVLQSFGLFCAIQLVILLGRTTSFDVERREGSAPARTMERREQKELTPLASSPSRKKAPPLPVGIPVLPPTAGEKSHYKSKMEIEKERNGS